MCYATLLTFLQQKADFLHYYDQRKHIIYTFIYMRRNSKHAYTLAEAILNTFWVKPEYACERISRTEGATHRQQDLTNFHTYSITLYN